MNKIILTIFATILVIISFSTTGVSATELEQSSINRFSKYYSTCDNEYRHENWAVEN